MELLKEAELWVGVGVVLFIVLMIWLKVPNAATKALDARAGKIQDALNEAERLREEARALLASLKTRREEAEEQARQMLGDAEAEAKRLQAEAKTRLEEQIVRRTELADRRIALAEQQAAAEVKAAAVDLAAQAAETILRTRMEGAKSDPLVDRAVAELSSRLQ